MTGNKVCNIWQRYPMTFVKMMANKTTLPVRYLNIDGSKCNYLVCTSGNLMPTTKRIGYTFGVRIAVQCVLQKF